MLYEGSNGSVEVDDGMLRIRRKSGLTNFLLQGIQGERTVPLSSIRAVQFTPASGMRAGYIQFSVMGAVDRPGGIMEATKDENAVLFTSAQQSSFEELRKFVESAIQTQQSPKVKASDGDLVGQIEMLAALLEKGVLTREEFEIAKLKLLS